MALTMRCNCFWLLLTEFCVNTRMLSHHITDPILFGLYSHPNLMNISSNCPLVLWQLIRSSWCQFHKTPENLHKHLSHHQQICCKMSRSKLLSVLCLPLLKRICDYGYQSLVSTSAISFITVCIDLFYHWWKQVRWDFSVLWHHFQCDR